MAFYDKIKDKVNKYVDTDKLSEIANKTVASVKQEVNKVIDSKLSSHDPLEDPTVKEYFEIICGMALSLGFSVAKDSDNNEIAKNYVEYFSGRDCDLDKLKKALELFNISNTDHPSGDEATALYKHRKSTMASEIYQMDRFEAHKLFCQDEINRATIEYDWILDVIKDNVNYVHFTQGIRKTQYSGTVISIVMSNSFFEENPITKKLLADYLIDSFIGRINCQSYNTHDDIALLVLRALHFDKFKNNKTDYPKIPEEDYRNFVLNVPYYKKVIDNNPFDKDEYIERAVKRIKSGNIFYGVHSSYKSCFHPQSVNDYYCDAICNFLWKEILNSRHWINENNEEINDPKNVRDLFSIICTFFNKKNNEA